MTPGDRPFQVFDLPFGKVGINICYDISFPESARVLKLMGAELVALDYELADRRLALTRFRSQHQGA